jgi:hypothetical protein
MDPLRPERSSLNETSKSARSSHDVLTGLDRTLYRLQRLQRWTNTGDDKLLLLGRALRLLGLSRHQLYPHPGSFIDLLEHNDIYSRTVALPGDLRASEIRLLIVFSESDN